MWGTALSGWFLFVFLPDKDPLCLAATHAAEGMFVHLELFLNSVVVGFHQEHEGSKWFCVHPFEHAQAEYVSTNWRVA